MNENKYLLIGILISIIGMAPSIMQSWSTAKANKQKAKIEQTDTCNCKQIKPINK